jgi:scyllo-inositol 2-dehydrogenase (NADP+)
MIRAGLIGFGLGGRVFHAPLLSSVEGVELAAVVERTSNHAAERYPGIVTYRNVDALLADTSLDLIVVTTPNESHYQHARQAIQAGKNVVVDKPMCIASSEIAELIALAATNGVLLVPFHNRRWDSDFLTLRKVLADKSLGRLVYFESTMDRWRPDPSARMPWKNDPAQGGHLLDLGTHLADQPLTLFGNPEAVNAEIERERDGEGATDAFTLRLHYPGLTVVLSANLLSSIERPRYHLRGTKGNYLKRGVEPQEAALSKVTRIAADSWGREAASAWGTLVVDVDGGMVTRPVESIPGDYLLFYAEVRDALLGKAPVPVSAIDAWRVARLLEWAAESSQQSREIVCDWSETPK